MLFEGIEVRGPERAVGLKPVVEFAEWGGADAVETALSIDADIHEAAVAEDAEMLGNCRLAEAEGVHEVTDGALAFEQEIEDAAPVWFGEELERGGHWTNIRL